jgi:hypothetical protein
LNKVQYITERRTYVIMSRVRDNLTLKSYYFCIYAIILNLDMTIIVICNDATANRYVKLEHSKRKK